MAIGGVTTSTTITAALSRFDINYYYSSGSCNTIPECTDSDSKSYLKADVAE